MLDPLKSHGASLCASSIENQAASLGCAGLSLGVTLRLCSRACSSLSAGRCPCTAQEFSALCQIVLGFTD